MIKRFPILRLLALAVALTGAAFIVLSLVDHDGRAESGGGSRHGRPTHDAGRAQDALRARAHSPAPVTAEVSLGRLRPVGPRPAVVPRVLDRVLDVAAVGASPRAARAGSRPHPRPRRPAPGAAHRRRLGRPYVLGPPLPADAAVGVRARTVLGPLRRVARAPGPVASDSRPQSRHGILAEGGALGGAARHDLPRRSIIGFEIGNEPDIYDRWSWVQQLGHPQAGTPFLPRRLSAARYLADFRAYAHALVRVAPRIPLVGPALANPQTNFNWLAGLITGAHPGLGLVSAHRYPYSACVRRTAPRVSVDCEGPERERDGGSRADGHPVRSARRALRFAVPSHRDQLRDVRRRARDQRHVRHRPVGTGRTVRTDEGGRRRRERARPRVCGQRRLCPQAVRLPRPAAHVRPDPVHAHDRTRARRLVPLRLRIAPSLDLKAWGVRLRNGRLHVLLLDKGPRPVSVRLRLPGRGDAWVQRLDGAVGAGRVRGHARRPASRRGQVAGSAVASASSSPRPAAPTR